ncbi:putative membrane protein [Sulfurospirillum multivorans DSM 12446]|uniref:Membrane protein n=2 Tax=Sulfurospirillum multivorans TaxID=66821 RepID=A0AA86AKH6_SULMK|nr:putative membrane protein [Sulfurospirillum multivorans DSM 12446]
MKMTTTSRLVRFYLFGDVLVVLLSLFQGGDWLLNTQMAFVCSLLITLASFRSYHTFVERRVDAGLIPDDKFDRYYEDDKEDDDDEQESVAPSVAKVGFKQSFQNLALSYKSALSLYRILSYGVLFLAVLFLIRHDTLDAVAFFVGLSVVPLSSFLSVLFVKKGFE